MLYIDKLIIEVTRRCNLTCEHCLRGNAQNLDMCRNHVVDLLSLLDREGVVVDSITFTGGEPLLNLEFMNWFLDVKPEHVCIQDSRMWFSTNGTVTGEDVDRFIIRYLRAQPDDMDEFATPIQVSRDQFHYPAPDEEFWKIWKPFMSYTSKLKSVIPVGRARENYLQENYGLASKSPDSLKLLKHWDRWCDDTIDTVYLTCTGKVSFSCDFPFRYYDRFGISIEEFQTKLQNLIREVDCAHA